MPGSKSSMVVLHLINDVKFCIEILSHSNFGKTISGEVIAGVVRRSELL